MEQSVAIGKVVTTHGVKGGMKVQPLSDNPERIKELIRVFVEKDGHSAARDVVEAFVHGRAWVIRLEGIDSCDAARELVGAMLTIPISERLPLPENSYYLDQIIGLDVYTVDGTYLGSIINVLETGSNDVYVVENKADGRQVLIPALKAVVKSIDLDTGRMEVDPPEGLL
ncbi:ribosome maturation factor RimM [Dethiobacter alkaliphilus]|uniref:Ribosome maturation factor RimM n=1 Tax=Dethiobacter alkaliphilus AHT 1 TaxID=555088 RepID=C0GHL9_DETAL|nr:ribosome maturation factor RimM [Dethiobacter alkaliphilus]EEG77225.1 16S rRNA processing protein RimM [Dethiobacter alkaliphilus AHT 1]